MPPTLAAVIFLLKPRRNELSDSADAGAEEGMRVCFEVLTHVETMLQSSGRDLTAVSVRIITQI